jgi:hypothetical protein
MAYSGRFKPKNPQKYAGDPSNIIYRSSWECRVMDWLDKNDDILSWGSEEISIPYISPVDGKPHRYYPDFVVKFKDKDNKHKIMILEVKPKYQTQQPKKPSRVTKKYIQDVVDWGKNQAKWKVANEYCMDRGWEFKLITEDHLGL